LAVNHTDKFLLVIQRLVRDTGLDESRIITLLSNGSVANLAVNHTDEFLLVIQRLVRDTRLDESRIITLLSNGSVAKLAVNHTDKFLLVIQRLVRDTRLDESRIITLLSHDSVAKGAKTVRNPCPGDNIEMFARSAFGTCPQPLSWGQYRDSVGPVCP
jgi:hypothetical protein